MGTRQELILKRITMLFILLTLVLLIGCREEANLRWSVSEDRTVVSGVIECDCAEADVEMLVTNENTGEDYISTFTVDVGIRFERPIGIVSDWVSVDLKVVNTR